MMHAHTLMTMDFEDFREKISKQIFPFHDNKYSQSTQTQSLGITDSLDIRIPTPQLMESSVGNFTTNLLPAFSSEEFSGRIRQTTLMPHSSAGVDDFVADLSMMTVGCDTNYVELCIKTSSVCHYNNKRIRDHENIHNIEQFLCFLPPVFELECYARFSRLKGVVFLPLESMDRIQNPQITSAPTPIINVRSGAWWKMT